MFIREDLGKNRGLSFLLFYRGISWEKAIFTTKLNKNAQNTKKVVKIFCNVNCNHLLCNCNLVITAAKPTKFKVMKAVELTKTVKVEDSKSVTNAVDNFDAPVMDGRILKLNELKAVKTANLSKGKRPAAKEAKELATYILNNWDDEFELLKVLNAENIHEDLRAILASRLENFADAKKACEEAVKETKKAEKAPKAKTEKKETKKAAPAKATKADSKKEEPKAKEEVKKETNPAEEKKPTKKAGRKVVRKVGDIHKNGLWFWKEYKPGKFDWRAIKK